MTNLDYYNTGYDMNDDQPKPTGGEWTAQTVFDLLGSDYGTDGWKRERAVADAHNAALAAAKGTCDQCSRKLEDGQLFNDHQPKPTISTGQLPPLKRGTPDYTSPKPTGDAELIRVGPSWVTCKTCGEEYNTSSIHVCPKPTGEWTVSTIDEWISLNPSTWRSVIAFEHKAALDAEKAKHCKDCCCAR